MCRLLLSCMLLLFAACGDTVPERPGAGDSTQNTTVPEDMVPEHFKPGADTVATDSGR